jgi:hypothetical protein
MVLACAIGMSPLLRAEHRGSGVKEKILVIGGSAAAGAALGGWLGGKEGALAGAIAGGSGGAIYDDARRTEGHERTTRDRVVLIGGSGAAGAAAGGIVGGRRGAAIGAAIGAAGGWVLERKTRGRW